MDDAWIPCCIVALSHGGRRLGVRHVSAGAPLAAPGILWLNTVRPLQERVPDRDAPPTRAGAQQLRAE